MPSRATRSGTNPCSTQPSARLPSITPMPNPLATWIGRGGAIGSTALPRPLASWDCRNNRLAWLGLVADDFIDAAHAARERYGAARVALVLGTSTSSIGATEDAYRALDE